MKKVAYVFFCAGIGFLGAAVIAYYQAKAQARQPPLVEGQGGTYQRLNERRWRRHAANRLLAGVALIAAAIMIYLGD